MIRSNLSIHFQVHKIQSSMSNFRPTMAPACRLQILPPLRYINSSLVPIQQPTSWGRGFYGDYSGPVYQPMTPFHQQRPPNSGPTRNQRRMNGSRKAEPQTLNQPLHESSGTALCGRSNGVGIDANNNPGIGKVWRTPPKNPFIADCNSS